MGQTWKSKIENWLADQAHGGPVYFVGIRSVRWIESMRQDLKRWGLPVDLVTIRTQSPSRKIVELIAK